MSVAGVNIRQPATRFTADEYDFVVDINLKGAFFIAQEVGKQMVQQGSGSIINIDSLNTYAPLKNVTPYAMSKAGVVMMTRSLALEWGSKGVRVNSIAPGFILPLLSTILAKESHGPTDYRLVGAFGGDAACTFLRDQYHATEDGYRRWLIARAGGMARCHWSVSPLLDSLRNREFDDIKRILVATLLCGLGDSLGRGILTSEFRPMHHSNREILHCLGSVFPQLDTVSIGASSRVTEFIGSLRTQDDSD